MTVLERYLNEKESTYHPIPRRGQPRGAPLGIQQKGKYLAALYSALLSARPASIAHKHNVPVKTMKGWCAQPAWKNTVEAIQSEFADLVIKRLLQIIADQDNGSTRSIHTYPDFQDANNYSKTVVNKIGSLIVDNGDRHLSRICIDLWGGKEARDIINLYFLKGELLKVREILYVQKPISKKNREDLTKVIDWAFAYVMEGGF